MFLFIILMLYILQVTVLYAMYEKGTPIKNIDIILACLAPLNMVVLLVVKITSHYIDLDETFLHKE